MKTEKEIAQRLADQMAPGCGPVVIAQLNTTDMAARRAATLHGLSTAGIAPRGRYAADVRRQHGVEEAETASFRQADVLNVRLAKEVAHAVAERRGDTFDDVHHAALARAAHVGLLYSPRFTGGKPSGAGTLKTSACLVSPECAYEKGYDQLPRPQGLEAAMARGARMFREGNRLFILDLTAETAAAAGALLGSALGELQPYSLVVSGPDAESVPTVDVARVAAEMFGVALSSAGWHGGHRAAPGRTLAVETADQEEAA